MLCVIEIAILALIAWRTRYKKTKYEGENP